MSLSENPAGELPAAHLRPGDWLKRDGALWRCGRITVSPDAVTIEAEGAARIGRPLVGNPGAPATTTTLTTTTLALAPGEIVQLAAAPTAPSSGRTGGPAQQSRLAGVA